MQREYVIEKLVSAMSHLSDQDLSSLAELFRCEDVAQVFREVVERMIHLRRIEQERRGESSLREEQASRSRARARRMGATEPAEVKFLALLDNRTLFPSTRDVIDVLNDIFDLGLRYDDYQKEGRRDLIQRCWRHFQRMPLTERRRVLRALSQRSEGPSSTAEGYHELFRILSQK